ncbi:hypothetical protein SAMN05443665_103035 [Actinomadura meyerae]|uniref:PH domain-containing protein n=1 Tax=Actinomadura meyerae TaxID=240840 RepID=A0A239MP66_9ACTN|nr:hypothetical protein [Actinomadura meyerae]SNT44280.1 hypothetical protein SAMN05443665_103035 [Actinomadura meyerae]
MKRLYERSSRRSEPGALDPELRAAIAAHAREHLLGDALGGAEWCCVTRSVRLKRPGPLARLTGSGDPDAEHTTVALLLPTYLVVAVAGERRGVHVRSIWLGDVSIDVPPPVVPDTGVTATGPWSGAPKAASFHLALGDDADGKAFLTALRNAVTAAKSRG